MYLALINDAMFVMAKAGTKCKALRDIRSEKYVIALLFVGFAEIFKLTLTYPPLIHSVYA